MKFTVRTKIVLLLGLIILNVLFRYPVTPHEIGWDSFEIHALANSVTEFGHAKWWVHSLSIVGMYPLSYASSVPFFLSGMSQTTSIDMELIIWIFSLVIGTISVFFAYLLAGLIWDNDIFKFLVPFTYTLSSGMLTLTTWTLSTRGFFVVLLPLLIYLMIKSHFLLKYGVLTILIFILMLATHNLVFMTLPIIVGYSIVTLASKYDIHEKVNIPVNYINVAMVAGFCLMFLIPFLTRGLWTSDPEIARLGLKSRYVVMFSLVEKYFRYIGISSFFIVSGYISLAFKRNKKFSEWFMLLIIAGLAPLLFVPTYTKWFILPIVFLLIAIGLTNVVLLGLQKKVIRLVFVAILLLSISFSGYYQFLHFPDDTTFEFRYMDEKTYVAGLWIKDSVDKNIFWDAGLVGLRIFAVSGKPVLFGGPLGLAYNFTDIKDIDITKNSPLSTAYYKHGAYIKTPGTPYTEGYINQLSKSELNSKWGKRLVSQYNLSYIIDSRISATTFTNSINNEMKDSVYDNGINRIWRLD